MKLYVVMAGAYSSTHVAGIYSTPEKAAYAAKLFDGEVETWEVDALPDHPHGMLPFYVKMLRDGEAISVWRCEHLDISRAPHWSLQVVRNDGLPYVQMLLSCWASDEKHAVKIANECRTQAIASGEWDEALRKVQAGIRRWYGGPEPTIGPSSEFLKSVGSK